jgi:hypothetical protein
LKALRTQCCQFSLGRDMEAGSIVIVSLHSPREKFWGRLLDLTVAGVTVRGLDLNAFEDWIRQFGGEEATGLTTVFYPLHRIERIVLDEPEGIIPSLKERFQQKSGLSLDGYLAKTDAERA